MDLTHVENETEFTSSLLKNKYDIILSDFKLPSFDAFGALIISNEICPEVPFICVSGSIGEETAIELLKLGAVDYVLKDKPERLPFAIKRALEEAKEKASHQLAAKALLESENRFKQVAEDAQEWIWEVDKDGLYTYASPVVHSLLGYSADEIVGQKHFYDFFIPEKKEELKKAALEIFASRESFRNFENPNIHKDGHLLILSTSGSPIFNSEGNFIGYRGVDSDMTEQKMAEIALRESEEKFRNLFQDHSAAKLIIDPIDGTILEANHAAANFYGWPVETLKKMNIAQINTLPPNVLKKEIENAKKLKKINFEFQHRKVDGSLVDVEVFSSSINIGDKEYLHSIIHDITEKKKAEEKLKLLNRAVEASSVSVIITDAEGNINYVNPYFTELTGYSYEEVKGKNPRLLKSGHQSKEFYERLWNTIFAGTDWSGELYNKKKNGELYWENVVISPIINRDGLVTNFVAIKDDITERKKMLEELVAAKEKAEEMNRLKSYFFANMSHELRTPFIGIMGYAELLYDELENKEHLEMLDGILNTSNRMLSTLANILTLTKLEFNGIELKFQSFSYNSLLETLSKEFEIIASKKGLKLIGNYKEENLIVESDEQVIGSIISNLLSNAVKYTKTGEVVLYSELETFNNSNFLLIKIIDSGIGIPEEKKELIFDEFRQVSEGATRHFEGTGLGLAIVKKMVNQLGGTISVESELGKGSTFSVSLPVKIYASNFDLDGQSNQIKSHTIKTEKLSRKTLLYIEDDLISQDVVRRALSTTYYLDLVHGAEDAFKLINQKEFDAFLIDINLGSSMDGLELVNQINQITKYKATPKIAVTAFASEEDRSEFLNKGFTHYVSKPFLMEDLKELLAKLFSD